MIEYKWTPVTLPDVLPNPRDIEAALESALAKACGDFRVALGYSRKPSAEEIAAENYCHECNRPYDED